MVGGYFHEFSARTRSNMRKVISKRFCYNPRYLELRKRRIEERQNRKFILIKIKFLIIETRIQITSISTNQRYFFNI